MLSIWRAVSRFERSSRVVTHQIVIYSGGLLHYFHMTIRSGFLVFFDKLWESGSMLGRVLAISGGTALVILMIILQLTTPSTIGSLGLLFVFILMYVIALSALTFFLRFGNQVLRKTFSPLFVRRPLSELSLQRSYYYASIIALAPVIFIGMQSVGVVSFYDVLLIVTFIALACFYIARRSA